MDVLKENNVKAAFFITAHYLNTAPELVQRMIDEGHIVGNHTINHPNLPKLSDPDKISEELIGMKKDEIIGLVDDGYGIEDKLEDLNGLTIEIIANVSFDEFNEENRLRPKKLLNKYF